MQEFVKRTERRPTLSDMMQTNYIILGARNKISVPFIDVLPNRSEVV